MCLSVLGVTQRPLWSMSSSTPWDFTMNSRAQTEMIMSKSGGTKLKKVKQMRKAANDSVLVKISCFRSVKLSSVVVNIYEDIFRQTLIHIAVVTQEKNTISTSTRTTSSLILTRHMIMSPSCTTDPCPSTRMRPPPPSPPPSPTLMRSLARG